MAGRVLWSLLLAVSSAISLATENGTQAESAREAVITIVTQIQRADYEGDRAALNRFYKNLAPFVDNRELASRVRYWRGFALWRRVINGFNETVDPNQQQQDLQQAIEEFSKANAADPGFVDAKVGAVSCLSILYGLNQKDPERQQQLLAQGRALFKEAQAAAPENPRLLWVQGINRWYAPPERGGGQAQALATLQQGLEASRKPSNKINDPLDPSWGEPECLMMLAYYNLNRTTPDMNAAEQNARADLALVPYWHYVRDILIPQIRDAKAKSSDHSPT